MKEGRVLSNATSLFPFLVTQKSPSPPEHPDPGGQMLHVTKQMLLHQL